MHVSKRGEWSSREHNWNFCTVKFLRVSRYLKSLVFRPCHLRILISLISFASSTWGELEEDKDNKLFFPDKQAHVGVLKIR